MLNDEKYEKFLEALDRRLLDICTSGLGDLLLSIDEYETWKSTDSIRHVATVVVVDDAVAGAFQESFRCGDADRLYALARERVGAKAIPTAHELVGCTHKDREAGS
jgi:hypothetical protein